LHWIDPLGRDVKIRIVRDTYTEKSITGTLTVTSDKILDTFTGYTLENTRGGYKGDKDPVSTGTYSAKIRHEHQPNRIELNDVPGYTEIQLHVGNEPKDVKGCFAVGKGRKTDWLEDTHPAMKKILEIIEKDATGNITVEIRRPWMGERGR
jgi:hypothetical protein